jgi:hypothetical protein
MSGPLIFQIFAGILVVLFLVAVIMGHKSWKAHTIIMVFVVFLSAFSFMCLSGMVLKTHKSWREILHGPYGKPEEGLIQKTLELEKANHELEFGKEKANGEVIEDGIVQLKRELRAMTYDRGRVFTECKPAPMAGNSTAVQVTIDSPTPTGITPNTILYLFDTKPLLEQGSYLGEYRVTNVVDPGAVAAGGDDAAAEAEPGAAAGGQPASITLQPAWPLSPFEMTRLVNSANRGGPWNLHDKMPADSHTVFHDMDGATAKELGVPDAELANLDKTERLLKLLPSNVVPEYVKDQEPPEAGDPERRIHVFVEFQDDHTITGPGGETYAYEKKQKVWLPKESLKDQSGSTVIPGADELAAAGIVEIEDDEQRYVRSLRDYGHLFRELYLQRDRRSDKIIVIDVDVGSMGTVLTDKLKVVADFEAENRVVKADRDRFVYEMQTLSKLVEGLRQEAIATYRQMTAVRQMNVQLAERLYQLQMRAIQDINRRTPSPQAGDDSPPTTNRPRVAAST